MVKIPLNPDPTLPETKPAIVCPLNIKAWKGDRLSLEGGNASQA